MQRFAKPWWKRRALRVFRDETSLSANPHLWSSIAEALDNSAWFILLLSPDAAESSWVNQEIEYWRKTKDPSRILPVLTEGTLQWTGDDLAGTAIPKQLLGVYSEQPRWVDLRFAADEELVDLKNPRFSAAVADIASTLRGVPKDELESEEVRQHRLTKRTAWGAIALIGVLAVAAVGFAIQSLSNAEEARLLAQAEAEARAEAEVNARSAEAAARRAEVQRLAATSLASFEDDPRKALTDAIKAVEISKQDGTVSKEAEEALRETVQSVRTVLDLEAHSFVRFITSGEAIVTGSPVGTQLWSVDTGNRLQTLGNQVEAPSTVAVSGDDSLIATASADGLIQVWDARSYEEVTSFEGQDSPFAMQFSPSGDLLAVSYPVESSWARGQVKWWDTSSWELVVSRTAPNPAGIAFNEDGSQLAAATSGGLLVWAAESGDLLSRFPLPDDSLFFADVAYAGDRLVAAAADAIHIYDAQSQTEVETFFSRRSDVSAIDIFNSDVLAAGFVNGEAAAWDIATGRLLARVFGLGSEIVDLDFDSTGELLAAATSDGVRVWDVSTDGSYEWFTLEAQPEVFGVDVSEGGSLLASVGTDPEPLVMWDMTTGKRLRAPRGHQNAVFRARFGPESLLATASFDSTARIWNADVGEAEHVFSGGLGPVLGVAFSEEGTLFAYSYGTQDVCLPAPGFVDVRMLDEGELIFSEQVADTNVTDVRLSPDGSWFAAAACGKLFRWDIRDNALAWEVDVIDIPNTPILSIDISPDGSLVATAAWDGVVRVWDSQSGQLVGAYEGHSAQVNSVAFSSDGSLVASGSEDGTARIWSVETGEENLKIRSHQTGVVDVTFSPDDRRLITAGAGVIRVHALDIDDLLTLAHEKLRRFR